jgi:CheY-like chemotaxis protein
VSPSAFELRDRFHARFCEAARARLGRSLELLGARPSAHAAAIRLEFYSLAGESAFLGHFEVAALARKAEDAAGRIPEDPTAIVGCVRAVRALTRALTALEAPPAEEERPAPSSVLGPRFRGRILVVDDSKLNADLLTALLSEEGFAVETAHSEPGFEHALATFRPDLVLSDVDMPELDCAIVCRRVREPPPTRIVLISGLAEDVLARECRRLRADGYITRDRGLTAVLERVISELAEAPAGRR